MSNWIKLVISLALPQLAAFGGSRFTETGEGSWYRQINKPEWNPPGWVFGPVWTTLYILMGIALYLVWKSDAPPRAKKIAIGFWLAQLVANFFWSVVFFGMQNPGLALAEISLLWLLILFTILSFARIKRLAAWLMVPYISWVSFAAYLNLTIWQLNQ